MDLTAEGEILVLEGNPSPTVGGFDFVFVDELPSGQKCSICLLAMRDPVQTKCGHRFCESCLTATFSEGSATVCPHDRQIIPENGGWFRDVAWEREILSLRVKCNKSERGCDWIGQIRHYQEHFDVCQYEDVTCEKCIQAVQRRFLETHTATECPNRIVKCQYCDEEFEFWLTEVHVDEECPRFPLDCPQQCGVQQIPREEMQSHLQDDCLMTMVECPYEGAECFCDKRSNLKAHIEASREEHLSKTRSNLLKATERLDELEDVEDDIGDLLIEKVSMKARLNQLELSNCSQIGELQTLKEQFKEELEKLEKQTCEEQDKKESMKRLLDRNSKVIIDLSLSNETLTGENMALKKDVTELRTQLDAATTKVQDLSRLVQNIYCKFQAMQEKKPLNAASQLRSHFISTQLTRQPAPRPYSISPLPQPPHPSRAPIWKPATITSTDVIPLNSMLTTRRPDIETAEEDQLRDPEKRPHAYASFDSDLAKKRKIDESKCSNEQPEKTICRERRQLPNWLLAENELLLSSPLDDKEADEESDEDSNSPESSHLYPRFEIIGSDVDWTGQV